MAVRKSTAVHWRSLTDSSARRLYFGDDNYSIGFLLSCLLIAPVSSSFTKPVFPSKATWLLIVAGLVIHAGFAGLLTLSVDEAHYALYAQHLDLSYFDHPPMVGWIQWPLLSLGAPEWVLRIIPQVLWLVGTLLAWKLAENLQQMVSAWRQTNRPDQAGFWAVLMMVLGPVFHVLAVGLLPDTLLLALVPATMLVSLSLVRDRGQGLRAWLLLGVLFGLAGLSKYTAVLFALATAGMLCLNLGSRILLTPGPWIAVAIAAIMVSPVFYWNAMHDWISFKYQISHSSGGTWHARRLLAFIGLQIVAFGPLMVVTVWQTIRFLQSRQDKLVWGLWLFFLIPFAVTFYMSGGGRTLPHWMAPAWLAAIAVGANPVAQCWNLGKVRLLRGLSWLQGTLCTLAFAVLFFVGLPFLPQDHELSKKNPLADLWGWDYGSLMAKDLARQYGIDTLTVGNWTLASRLAWYAKPLPVIVLDDRFDQFDLWFGSLRPGQDAIFVNWSQAPYNPPTGEGRFKTCELAQSYDSMRLGRTVSSFQYFICRDWQGQ